MLILLTLLACGDKDTDTAADEAVTFTEVQQTLTQSCGFSSCHGSGSGELTLDGDDYDDLVDAPSAEADGRILVVAGSADQSYLVQKLEGAAGIEGDPMPPGGGLDQAIIDDIRAWIDEGALDN